MSTRDDPTELAKAALHRDQQARRALAAQGRARLLSGSRTARGALADAWAPIKVDRRWPERPPVTRAGQYPLTYPPTY